MGKASYSLHICQCLIFNFSWKAILTGLRRWYLIVNLICISQMVSEIENLTICMCYFEKSFYSLPHFLISIFVQLVWFFFFLMLNYMTSLYILDIKLFSDKYFLTFCRLCFHIVDFSFAMQKLFMCLFPALGRHTCLFLLSLLLHFWCTVHNIIARTISKSFPGASLVVQWIRICLAMQGTQVWSLAWEDSMCHRAVKWSSTTTKPML